MKRYYTRIAFVCMVSVACGEPVPPAGDPWGQVGARDDEVGPHGCVTDVSVGHSTFTCEGPTPDLPIIYDVEVPDCDDCRLVLELHGGAQFGDALNAITGMRARASQRDFIVVQPTAPYPLPVAPFLKLWFHPQASDSVQQEERQVVTPLLHDFVQDAIRAYGVDEDEVYVTGYSQGGGLTWDLLCAYPDTFEAAAPVSAEDPALPSCFDGTGPEGGIPILRTHGVEDLILPFDEADPLAEDLEAVFGLELGKQACYGGRLVGEDGEGCPDGTLSSYEADDGADLLFITHTLHSNADGFCEEKFGTTQPDGSCTGGFPDQGGHCYPGVGRDLPYASLLEFFEWLTGCGPNPDIQPLSETILDFFEDPDFADDLLDEADDD